MYMTGVTMVAGPAAYGPEPPAANVRALLAAVALRADGLQHAHVAVARRTIEITLFIQAESQCDANRRARRICTRASGLMPGWHCTFTQGETDEN